MYITVLVGTLAVFSSLYRKRKANKAASLKPWFGPHYARDIYLTLLHQENTKVPDTILKAALLRRATEDIRRIIALRQAKGSLQQLLQKGNISDDLWTRFTVAEAEIQEELRDVVLEANAFKDGWGNTIFQTANEMANAQRIRDRTDEVTKQAEAERKWWDEKRKRSQRELLGEVNSDEDGVLVESAAKKQAKVGA